MSELQRLEKPYKRIMIVGGGNVGAGTAAKLEKDYNVKLIERNQQRAAELAEQLHDTIVFYGDASDQSCWPKSTSSKWMSSSLSPTTMRPTSCPPCWPNAWAPRR